MGWDLDLDGLLQGRDGDLGVLGLGDAEENLLDVRAESEGADGRHGVVDRGLDLELLQRIDIVPVNRFRGFLDDVVLVLRVERGDVVFRHDLLSVRLRSAEELFELLGGHRSVLLQSLRAAFDVLVREFRRVRPHDEVGQGRAGNRSVPQETGVFRLQFGEAMEQLHFGESLVEDHDPVELLARGFADRTADVVLDTLEGAFPNLLRLGVNLLRREEEILFRHLGEAGEFAGVLQDLGDDAFHRVLELDDDDRVLRNQRKTRIVSRDVDRRQGLVADDAQFQELVTGVTRDAHVLGQNQLALARARRLEDVEGGEFLGIGFRRFLETVPTLRQNLRGLLQPRVVDLDDFEDTVAVHAPAVRHHALVQLGFLRGIRFPRETSLVEIAMMEDFADLDVRAV